MRKMKKINGYLVVKFNDRELREWEGTALGKYGVIDAELYTGTLEVDRGAMEYDNADSIEEAVELARGLESELDTEEPEVKVTLIKETDEATEEEEVDAQKMIAGWENTLRGQVASPHYKDVDERTAAHELYGYKAALRDLGLLDREDCYVLPDTFGEAPGPLPKKPEELLSYVCDELCRHHLPEMTQEQLDAVCARCSLERLADEADEAELRIRTKAHRELNGLIADLRDARPGAEAGRLEHEARAYLRRRRGRSQRARAQPSPPRSRRPAPPRPTRRSGRPSSTSTRSSSATGRRRRSTPWGWRWRRIARTTIAGSTSTSSTGPGSWTPPWTTWTRKALRRSPCGRRSENGSESWRRCSTGTSPSSSIGRRRDHERVRPL